MVGMVANVIVVLGGTLACAAVARAENMPRAAAVRSIASALVCATCHLLFCTHMRDVLNRSCISAFYMCIFCNFVSACVKICPHDTIQHFFELKYVVLHMYI